MQARGCTRGGCSRGGADGGRGERGQVVPLVALVVLVAGLMLLWLGRLGGAAVARAQARTAADAAALAGAISGRAAAASVAADNGARLVRFEARGDEAFVAVSVGPATASARAAAGFGPAQSARLPDPARCATLPGRDAGGTTPSSRPGGDGCGDAGGLSAGMQAALARAGALLGRVVPVTSGYRSRAEQEWLYAHRIANPYPVARPGYSAHERGTAVDVPLSFVPALLSVAGEAGLCHPYPAADPVHFELCP
jgi:hypothetical protein